jgi:phosphatidylserine decarboxylase
MDILFPRLHKEGYRFLAIAVVLTFIILLFSKILGVLGVFFTIWVYYFFRDPERISINDDNFLVSPADGIISQITEVNGPKELGLSEKKYTRVSIFMNVFNCHVNRFPASGEVTEILYKSGKFINASLNKSSEDNERNFVKFKHSNGDEMILVQIAGLIARRIVCNSKKDQKIQQGEKFGIIRFGSRVDLYFNDFKILVKKNQTTVAGETLIAQK